MPHAELTLNPKIRQFTIFSGGGGLVNRQGKVEVPQGMSEILLVGIPASFSQETFVARVEGKGITLRQIAIRKPTRQYVDDTLQREGACAQQLIQASTNIGARRSDIIGICEEVALRSYLDEEVGIAMTVEAASSSEATVELSYFIDDPRYRWKPFISVETDAGDEAVVEGFIAVQNESPHRFEDVDVAFAEFTHTASETGYLEKLDNVQYQARMKSQRMNVMMLK